MLGMLGAGVRGGRHRRRRGPRDLPGPPGRRHRRLLRHQRRHHPRLQGPLPAGGHHHLEGRHRVAAALQGRRPRGRRRLRVRHRPHRLPGPQARRHHRDLRGAGDPPHLTASAADRRSPSAGSPYPGRVADAHVLALAVDVRIPEAHSLKDKRSVVRTILEGARRRFGVSAAETGRLDVHQRAELGFVGGRWLGGPRGRGGRRGRAVRVVVPGDRGGGGRPPLDGGRAMKPPERTTERPAVPAHGAAQRAAAGDPGRRARAHRRRPPRAADHHRRSTSRATCAAPWSSTTRSQGEEGDEEVLEALGECAGGCRRRSAAEARIKRTPELTFAPDPAVRAGARIEELLPSIPEPDATVDPDRYPTAPSPAPTPRRAAEADGGRRRRPGPTRVSRRRGADGPDGLAVVDKEAGWTSHDVVAKARGPARHPQGRATRAPSTPTPPACCCSASAGPPACCGSSPRCPRPTPARSCSAPRPRPSTPPVRSPPPTTWPASTFAAVRAGGRRASPATSSRSRRWCRR